MFDPYDIRASDTAWDRLDDEHEQLEYEQGLRDRLATRAHVPSVRIDSLTLDEVEVCMGFRGSVRLDDAWGMAA